MIFWLRAEGRSQRNLMKNKMIGCQMRVLSARTQSRYWLVWYQVLDYIASHKFSGLTRALKIMNLKRGAIVVGSCNNTLLEAKYRLTFKHGRPRYAYSATSTCADAVFKLHPRYALRFMYPFYGILQKSYFADEHPYFGGLSRSF